jgi:hypothetical protein
MLPDIHGRPGQEVLQMAYHADPGWGNHRSGELAIPANVILTRLPAHSPELNPQKNIRDEIREKISKNYAAKSMDEVCNMRAPSISNATQSWSNA